MLSIDFKLPETENHNGNSLKSGRAQFSCSIRLIDKERDQALQEFLIEQFQCEVRNPAAEFNDSDDLSDEEKALLTTTPDTLWFDEEKSARLLKAIMQAPVIEPGKEALMGSQKIVLNGHQLNLLLMHSTIQFGEPSTTDYNASHKESIIPSVKNIYQIIPAFIEILAVGDNLTNRRELNDFVNELVELTDERRRLITLVTSLINNIEAGNKGRKTSGSGSEKVKSLHNLLDTLKDQSNQINKDDYLNQIEKICKQKRHQLHWWAAPHSVIEYNNLVEALHLKDSIITTNSYSS
ncbi:hypothetical protein ACFORL_08215 [Legionella dresdenensis]|uniref:Uncharacterized protein n=1 Tax=Legionella dresdenensis TaxID=450200 RepID=A0ABV8CFX3_9GAMM